MTTNIRWPLFLAVCAIVLLASVMAYFVYARSLSVLPEYGGTYVEGLAGSPIYLNPILNQYNDVDRDLCRLIFDGLTQINPRGEVVPNLALWWDVADDGLSYTFHLREGVHWHDGAPLTVEDVLFTIKAIQHPEYQGIHELAAFWHDVKVEAVNMYTVRFSLPQPFAPFPGYTTIGLLPAHLLSSIPPPDLPRHSFNKLPVGTGSFRVVTMDIEHIRLTWNPDDYRPKPYLDQLEFRFYPDYQSLLEAYGQGEIDGISRVPPELLPQAWQEESLNLYSAPLADCSLIFLNLNLPIFQDKTVRQALLYAIDRQALVNQVFNGQGVVASGPLPPHSWAYDPTVRGYAHDQELAKKLLDEAGWPEIDGQRYKAGHRLAFNLLTSDEPQRMRIAQEIAKQWAEVGIRATLQVVSPAELVNEYLKPRDFEALLYEWQKLPPDPDPYPLWHSTQAKDEGQNFAGLHDDRIDALLEEARLNRDPQVRKRLYHEFQQRFIEEVPALLLYYPVYNYAVSRRVRNVQLGPLADYSDRFQTIHAWHVAVRRVLASEIRSTPPP